MGTTPTRSIRYPEPTDRVQDGAIAMRHLAEDAVAAIDQADQAVALSAMMVGNNVTSTGVAAVLPFQPSGFTGAFFNGAAVTSNPSGSASTRLTAATAGVYLVSAAVRVQNAAGAAGGQLHLRVNSAGVFSGGSLAAVAYHPAAPAAGNYTYRVQRLLRLAAGDYVEVWAELPTGQVVVAGSASTADMTRIGS